MQKAICFIGIILIFIMSCKKDNTTENYSQSNLVLNSFPLTVGNTWKYYTESHVTDSSGVSWSDSYFDNTWTIEKDTTINGVISSKIFQLDSNYNGSIHQDYSYYTNTSDGFYGIAVQGTGSLLFLRESLKLTGIPKRLIGDFNEGIFDLDTVLVPDTSLHLLKFPSCLGDVWNSFEYNGSSANIKRTWLKDTTIVTAVGSFNCIKLQMYWDYDNNNLPDSGSTIVYQYFSTKGLIQENIYSELTFSSGGTGVWRRVTKLVSVNF